MIKALLLVVLVVASYLVFKYLAQTIAAWYRRNYTTLGKLYKDLDDAERRLDIAKNHLSGLDWTDPQHHRWTALQSRAAEDIRSINADINDYVVRQEEERMLNE